MYIQRVTRPYLMVPASLCRLHPYLVCLTPPGTQSTASGVTLLCLAFFLGFLCKEAERMVPASLCLLRAVLALCRTFGDRWHSFLVCPTSLVSALVWHSLCLLCCEVSGTRGWLHATSFSVLTKYSKCTWSHLCGQVTPRSGLSHASWNSVNSFRSDTVASVFLHCCEVSCARVLI